MDVGERFLSQKSTSIQPRTSFLEFARSLSVAPPASILLRERFAASPENWEKEGDEQRKKKQIESERSLRVGPLA